MSFNVTQGLFLSSMLCCVTCRYRCHFGLEDKSDVVPEDMQALLKSTQRKNVKKNYAKPKKWKKVILEYDAFPITKSTNAKINRVGKNLGGFPLKEDIYVVLWRNNRILIPLCACWFMRTPCTSTHSANNAMDQWSVGSGMR